MNNSRYILIGPVPTLEALHEALREYNTPFAQLIGIYSDHTVFSRRWYASIDIMPFSREFSEFETDSEQNAVLFTGIRADMA